MIATLDVPVGSRCRAPTGDLYVLTATGWVRQLRPQKLDEVVRAAIALEPGVWSPATLAEDLGVGVRRINAVLRSVPHDRRLVDDTTGRRWHLYPPGAPSRVDTVRDLLKKGPARIAQVAEAVGMAQGGSLHSLLKKAGARATGHTTAAMWVLA